MEITERNVPTIVAGFVLTFGLAALGTMRIMRDPAPMRQAERWSPAETAVYRAIDTHPDPDIRGPFAAKMRGGEIALRIAVPDEEEAMATFGPHAGAYVLTIDPARVAGSASKAGTEELWSILSHEHAHYRQYVEGEMSNYGRLAGRMTETACTLVVLVEIDAHAKACRDARAYGWNAPLALEACARTNATIAEHLLRARAQRAPECVPVWKHFAETVPKPRAAPPPARMKPPPQGRGGPIYLAPP